MTTPPPDRIDVYCDGFNAKNGATVTHRRGPKTAKIVSFLYDKAIGAWVGPFYVLSGRVTAAPPSGY